ncbi:phospholipase D, variant 3 [Balamuthia mandrillaris]
MLFKLQVLSLTLSTDSAFTHYTPKFPSRNVFLDIWSQGQPKRRYFVGRYSKAKQKSFSSIVHFTSTPVILQLSYGVGDQTLLYNNLGRHTLFEFLSEPLSFQKKVLPFGRGGPLYKLEYSLAPVQVTYGFALNEVSCLGQVSSVLRKDPLYAEVELNASTHSILPGTTNRYHLGTFGSNDVATIHTSNNCTFSTLSNFVITFFINGWLSDHVLGSITVTPLDEHLQNKTAKLMALDLSDIDAASSLYYEDDDGKDEDNKQQQQQQQQQQQSVENKETQTQQTKGKKKRKQKRRNNFMINEETLLKQQIEEEVNMLEKTRQQQNGVFLSVVVESPADEGAEPEEEELFMMDPAQTRQTKTLTLSSPEGGSYVIVFTLTKEYHALIPTSSSSSSFTSSSLPPSSVHTTTAIKQGTHVVPSAAWDYVNFRDNYIRQRELLKRSEQSVEDPPSSSSPSSSVIPAEPNSVRSSQFSQTTHGNSVDVLIDGVETFERIYECMMAAQHTISILAWEISLGFGLIRTHKSKIPLPSLTLPLSSKWVVLEDVLLSRALAGVVVRIIVWRHEILSRLNRFLYLGEVSIEREVAKMQKRCRKLNLICKVFDIMNMPDGNSEYSNPYDGADANVIVIIAGNPKGLYSCHHEKLVLIDAQCPEHAIAFTGGFDMARGRYDTPSHTPPRPFWEEFNPIASAHPHPHPSALPSAAVTELMGQPTEKELREREKQRGEQEERDPQEEQDEEERKKSFSSFSPSNQQTHHLFHRHHYSCAEEDKEEVEVPFLNTRILWHDTHMMLSGPVVQRLQLHFAQRWRHAFTGDAALTRAQTHIIRASQTCQRHRRHQRLIKKMQFTNCNIRLTRVWNGVFEGFDFPFIFFFFSAL